jgi:predicted  nucleic acid-binding Zn-ribbon protein
METRELYKQKYEAQMHEWSAKLDAMKAQTEKLTVQAKLDVKPHVDAVHAKFDAAKARVHEIASTTNDKWDDVVKGIDHAWTDLKSAAEGAYDALRRHKKD